MIITKCGNTCALNTKTCKHNKYITNETSNESHKYKHVKKDAWQKRHPGVKLDTARWPLRGSAGPRSAAADMLNIWRTMVGVCINRGKFPIVHHMSTSAYVSENYMLIIVGY